MSLRLCVLFIYFSCVFRCEINVFVIFVLIFFLVFGHKGLIKPLVGRLMPTRIAGALLRLCWWLRFRISPIGGRLASVHLAEQKPQHGLSIFPIKISQLNGDLSLLHATWLLMLRFEVFLLVKLAARLNQWQEIRVPGALDFREFLFKFHAFFLFNLLHGFQKELLNVRPLVQNHLAKCTQVLQLRVLEPDRLNQIA